MVALVAIDLVAVGFALYGGLVLREVYYGHTPIFWGILWTGEVRGLVPVRRARHVLVFWQAGLYAERERRAGFGRIVSSLIVVALLVLAFGLGTGHDFNTFGLIPTALVIAIVLDGLLRASYDAISREALHALGVRRRAIVVGEGEHLDHLLRTLGSVRGGIEYDFVGVVSEDAEHPRGADRSSARVDDLRAVLEQHPADELIVTDSDYTDRQLLQIVEHAHRSAVKVRIAPKTTELLVQRAEYVPGQGVPLFELQAARVRRRRVGGQADVRPARQRPRDRRRAAALARDRRGDQAHLARARSSTATRGSASASRPSGCSSSGRWSPARPTSRPSSSGRTRPRARSSRSATTPG